jgi:hypothetical protein
LFPTPQTEVAKYGKLKEVVMPRPHPSDASKDPPGVGYVFLRWGLTCQALVVEMMRMGMAATQLSGTAQQGWVGWLMSGRLASQGLHTQHCSLIARKASDVLSALFFSHAGMRRCAALREHRSH